MAAGGRVDQTSVPGVLRDHRDRIRALEATRPGSFSGRLSWGQLLNDGGVIDAGSGDWSCVWSNSGALAPFYPAVNFYSITFSPVFGASPSVLLTANNNTPAGDDGSPFAYFVEQHSIAVGLLVVVTFNLIGDAADGGFNFAAVAAS